MMSQPIRFFHVFLWIVGSNPAHTGLKLFIKLNCTINNTLQLQSILKCVSCLLGFQKGKVL